MHRNGSLVVLPAYIVYTICQLFDQSWIVWEQNSEEYMAVATVACFYSTIQ